MKIRTILLMGGLVLLGACSESKYDLDQLVPEEYHRIMYVNNSGKQEVTLYDTDEDNKYTFSVIKSGSDPSLTASVKVKLDDCPGDVESWYAIWSKWSYR